MLLGFAYLFNVAQSDAYKQFPVESTLPVVPAPRRLVPVQVASVNATAPNEDIQFDIQRGATRINIRWPVDKAESCAQWLGAWLK